jgi:Domain of unknown function (DUF4150)
MGMTVYANGMSVACKAADGKTVAAMPDVCLSPPSPPAGPIPIPYPNTAMASDTTNGSKTVKIGGDEVMLKNKSTFKKSTGDEAATKTLGMGVVSHQIQGEANFAAWSMDVKFEGENVPRHLDLMLHNEMCIPANTPTWPYLDGMTLPAADPVCKDLWNTLAATVYSELPPSMQPTPQNPSTVAQGQTSGGDLMGGASCISAKRVLRGQKYRHWAQGIERGENSNVKTCGSDTRDFEYTDSGRPYEGHAEAKIIEDYFASGAQGTLVLAITQAPCHECARLISEVNKGKDGSGNCDKIKVCLPPG